MKQLFQWLGWLPLVCLLACTPGVRTPPEPLPLTIEQAWSGTFPVKALELLPAGQRQSATGYLGDAQSFAGLWAALFPEQPLPEIDFRTQLVVFTRNVRFFNRTSIVKVTLVDGVAAILAIETMSAMPIREEVAMALAVVPRDGVRWIRVPGGENLPVRD